MSQPIKGLVAAPFTLMHADGSVNLDGIGPHAEMLAANGVVGAFVCGSTGEWPSLTVPERLQIAERWVTDSPDDLRIIVHVGHLCLDDCKTLAAHAQKIGACAIGTVAPCYFKPATLDDLIDFCAATAAAAPDLPFYYYHIPVLTGVRFPMSDLLETGAERIPTLAGLKFTDENLMEYRKCLVAQGGRFNVMFGRDEILLTSLALGGEAAVGSTYCYMAPIYQRVISAFESGDMESARAAQSCAIEAIELLGKYSGGGAGKAIMKITGLDCGPVRLPLRNLTDEQEAGLRADLERIGFFDYCSKVPQD